MPALNEGLEHGWARGWGLTLRARYSLAIRGIARMPEAKVLCHSMLCHITGQIYTTVLYLKPGPFDLTGCLRMCGGDSGSRGSIRADGPPRRALACCQIPSWLDVFRWLKLANGERDRYEYFIFTETLCCLGVKSVGNRHVGTYRLDKLALFLWTEAQV